MTATSCLSFGGQADDLYKDDLKHLDCCKDDLKHLDCCKDYLKHLDSYNDDLKNLDYQDHLKKADSKTYINTQMS